MKKPSRISFDISPQKVVWDGDTNESTFYDPPVRYSDVYVFCLLGRPDDCHPDPMDLGQWEFYVIATKKLDRECPRQKTIALNPLKSLIRRTTERSTTPYEDLACVIEMEGKCS